MDNVVVGQSSDSGILLWLAYAFAYTVRSDQPKLYSYLEAVLGEVEFEMQMEEEKKW